MNPPQLNLAAVAPIACVGVGAMVVLAMDVLLPRSKTFLFRPVTRTQVGTLLAVVSTAALGVTLLVAGVAFLSGGSVVFNPDNPMIRLDRFANFAIALIALASLLAVWLSHTYLIELRINHGEYYALLLMASAGMMLMASSVDVITIFLGLEIMSIPIYVLAGFDRRKLHSNESAMKYFLIGSFASAILLYGMALLYGTTGHTDLAGIRAGFDSANPIAAAGLGLVIVGFGFKVSSVPFHQWTPDVYEGAPTSVTAYMSVAVKAAAFLTFLRVLVSGFDPGDPAVNQVLWVLAALTMIVGNVTAIVQDNVKRMLAYSSIAHAGYLLLGFVAASEEGYAAVLFYLVAYVFMNLGAFGVIVVLANRDRDCDHIEDYAGLAQTRPGLAALMTLFLVALAGIPGTVGFIAKFTIFLAAVKAGAVWLTIIAVLTSVVSVYYYLRVPVMMYMHEPGEATPRPKPLSLPELAVLAICAVGVVFLGLFPNWGPELFNRLGALAWARESIAVLF